MSKERPTYTNEELLDGIRNADRNVFTALYSSSYQTLVWAAMRYVKDITIAEEIVQDTFLHIWEVPEEIVNVKSLKAYLYRTVLNQSINYINRQKNIAQHHLRISDDLSDEYIENLIEDYALKELLHKEIEKLPEQCRKVFKMSRLENMKYREIAEVLDIAEKTVENHMVNALRILRQRLASESDGIKRTNAFKSLMLSLSL